MSATEYNIKHSSFNNISAAQDDGGALFINLTISAFNIISVIFDHCSSGLRGGACRLIGQNYRFEKSCCQYCFTRRTEAFMWGHSSSSSITGSTNFQYDSIYNCPFLNKVSSDQGGHRSVGIEDGTQRIDKCNFSSEFNDSTCQLSYSSSIVSNSIFAIHPMGTFFEDSIDGVVLRCYFLGQAMSIYAKTAKSSMNFTVIVNESYFSNAVQCFYFEGKAKIIAYTCTKSSGSWGSTTPTNPIDKAFTISGDDMLFYYLCREKNEGDSIQLYRNHAVCMLAFFHFCIY